jgi:hypothetical protein
MNITRLLIAAFLGALVASIWSMVSWMALPWHHTEFRSFKDPAPVTKSIMAQSETSGIYMLPNAITKNKTPEKHEQWMKDAAKGPFSVIVLRREGMKISFPMQIGKMFLIHLLGALILTLLLAQTQIRSVTKKAIFVTGGAFAGGVMVILANWSWWGFPGVVTIVDASDMAITWLLAGITIGAVYKTS